MPLSSHPPVDTHTHTHTHTHSLTRASPVSTPAPPHPHPLPILAPSQPGSHSSHRLRTPGVSLAVGPAERRWTREARAQERMWKWELLRTGSHPSHRLRTLGSHWQEDPERSAEEKEDAKRVLAFEKVGAILVNDAKFPKAAKVRILPCPPNSHSHSLRSHSRSHSHSLFPLSPLPPFPKARTLNP